MLWSILLFMFDYDYTLEESGVETEEKSNKQVGIRLFYQKLTLGLNLKIQNHSTTTSLKDYLC